MTEHKSKDIDRIAQYIAEEEAKRQSAAAHGSTSALEAIMARIAAEVTEEAMRRKTGG